MPTLTTLQVGNQAIMQAAASAAAMLPGMPPTNSPSPQDAGWAEAHLFSDDAYSDFPTLAIAAAHFRDRPLAIPIRSTARRLYFGIWFDLFATAAAAGHIQFQRYGSSVLSIPFEISRTGDTAADTFGGALPGMDVWKLAGTDTPVLPASGALGPDFLSVTNTGTSNRYVTTLAPVRLGVTADSVRLVLWKWNLSNDSGASAFVHLAVISDA